MLAGVNLNNKFRGEGRELIGLTRRDLKDITWRRGKHNTKQPILKKRKVRI